MARPSCIRPKEGKTFFYFPSLIDRIEPQTDLRPWEEVRVSYGETFQPTDCYVERMVSGRWVLAGIVSIRSLNTKEQMRKYKDVPVFAITAPQAEPVYSWARTA